MGRRPQIITECPNKENTISLDTFRKQYPARFSSIDEDKFVLHGGGHSLRLLIIESPQLHTVRLDPQLQGLPQHLVLVYALNTSLIIWVPDGNYGIDLPYQFIALQALKEVSGKTALYLQVVSNEIMAAELHEPTEYTTTVEILIEQPDMAIMGFRGNEADLYLRSILNSHTRGIGATYQALCRCSALHFDTDSENGSFSEQGEQDDQNSTFSSLWFTAADVAAGDAPAIEVPLQWVNAGDADDLGADEELEEPKEDEDEAGMEVNVANDQLAGLVRRLEDSEDSAKVRRVG